MIIIQEVYTIEDVKDYPEKYSIGELVNAIHDAWSLYKKGVETKCFYEQTLKICNAKILRQKGNPEESFL